MVQPICSVVSGAFYEGRLIVASDMLKDGNWLDLRARGGGTYWPTPHISVESTLAAGTWSATYGGPIRYSSTDRVIARLPSLLNGVAEDEIVVLTPFRAQRALMRNRLQAAGFPRVRVSTIHGAQGSEHHTVIFDPVDGSNEFLKTTFGARQHWTTSALE